MIRGCLFRGGAQVAFDGVGSMPMARIENVRVAKQAAVDVELDRRSRNKMVRDAVRDSERHAPYAAEGELSLYRLCVLPLGQTNHRVRISSVDCMVPARMDSKT